MDKTYEKCLTRVQQNQAEYDRECAEWAEKGYRPHYCIHGVDLWTGYDNICGYCEESLTNEELAKAMYDEYKLAMNRMGVRAATISAEMMNMGVSRDLQFEIMDKIIKDVTRPWAWMEDME